MTKPKPDKHKYWMIDMFKNKIVFKFDDEKYAFKVLNLCEREGDKNLEIFKVTKLRRAGK